MISDLLDEFTSSFFPSSYVNFILLTPSSRRFIATNSSKSIAIKIKTPRKWYIRWWNDPVRQQWRTSSQSVAESIPSTSFISFIYSRNGFLKLSLWSDFNSCAEMRNRPSKWAQHFIDGPGLCLRWPDDVLTEIQARNTRAVARSLWASGRNLLSEAMMKISNAAKDWLYWLGDWRSSFSAAFRNGFFDVPLALHLQKSQTS